MTGKLSDLDRHLFAQLDRLSNAAMTADQLEAEVQRSDALIGLADQVVKNAKVKLEAAKLFATHGKAVLDMLPAIGGQASADTSQ